MPPRRTSARQISTSNGNHNHTLVNALEHLPPPSLPALTKSSPLSEDDLTPISSDAEVQVDSTDVKVEDAVNQVLQEAVIQRKRGRDAKKDISYLEHQASASEAEEEEQIETTTTKKATPKKRTPEKAKAAIAEAEDEYAGEGEEEEEVETVETPKKTPRRRTPKKATAAGTEIVNGNGDGAEEGEEKPKKVKKPTPKKSRLAQMNNEPDYDEDGNEIIKKKKKPKVYPKIEYEIPDVERKTTTFKGRLGYACLNTVLRGTKPDSIFCSRTCRIASIEEEGMELPKGLALLNVRDLKVMIEWNEQNKIRFMRMSSEMFPFASHAKYGYDLSFADEGLREAGELAKKYGHRLTMHPGQFTQLGSPKNGVVEASIRELDYQCEIMDRMGIGADGVMIIHMGGIYGDKPSTLARFKENYVKLKDNVKRRLVLENDEICYNVDDLLPLCNELEIPIIFDYHHDWIYPSSEPPSVLIPKIAETWKKRGIKMKQHLSEPRPGAESIMERRAHADRCKSLPDDLPDDVDLMIEAKDKEQAVFELYRIYGLEDVIHDNLRPPDPNPGMHTKGRKSSLKKKVKETGEVDSDGEPINLSDVEKEGDGGVGDESVSKGKIEVVTEDPAMEIDQPILKATKTNGRKRKSAASASEKEVEGEPEPEPKSELKAKPAPKKGRKSATSTAVKAEKEAEVEDTSALKVKNETNGVEVGETIAGEVLTEELPPKKKGRRSKGVA